MTGVSCEMRGLPLDDVFVDAGMERFSDEGMRANKHRIWSAVNQAAGDGRLASGEP
jgi:hypothetical protein